MTTTIEILKAARDLIAKPENWTQGKFARDADGNWAAVDSEFATCFCIIGAVARVQKRPIMEAEESHAVHLLAKQLGARGSDEVAIFNDGATHDRVLALFSKAISSAEEKQGAAS